QRHPSVALAYRVGSRAEMLGLDVEADGPGLRIEAHRLAGEGIGVCLPERPAKRGRHVFRLRYAVGPQVPQQPYQRLPGRAFARVSACLEELGRRPLAHADEDAAAGDVPVHRLMRAVEVRRDRMPPGPLPAAPPQGFPGGVRQTNVASRPQPLHVVRQLTSEHRRYVELLFRQRQDRRLESTPEDVITTWRVTCQLRSAPFRAWPDSAS